MTEKKTSLQRRRHQLDLPLRAVDLSFFQMFSQQIKAGLIAEIGTSAFAVFVVVKAHARVQDGRSYVTQAAIEKATGLAPATVRRAIQLLEERSLLQVVEDGRKRRYFVLEHLPFVDVQAGDDATTPLERLELGQHDGKVMVRYVPARVVEDRQQIAGWAKEGLQMNSPNIQVVGQQVVAQQIVGEAHIGRLVVDEIVLGDGEGSRKVAELLRRKQEADAANERAKSAPVAVKKSDG